MYAGGVLLADEERLAPVRRLEHVVAMSTQDVAGDDTHLVVIIDEKDGLRSAEARGHDTWPQPLAGGGTLDAREVDLEGRSLAELAVDPQMPTALLDDPEHSRQP